MADNNSNDTDGQSLFEQRLSGLHWPTNKYAVVGFVEQLLIFLVDLHSGNINKGSEVSAKCTLYARRFNSFSILRLHVI